MGSLQRSFETQLAALPRQLATELVRKKLKKEGHGDNERWVAAVVDHMLAGKGDGTIEFEDEDGDAGGCVNLKLNFDTEDLTCIDKITSGILEDLQGLAEASAKQASDEMLRRYERDWAKWRPQVVEQMDQFRINLEWRWGKGFDALRMLIELSRDVGATFRRRAKRSRSIRQAHLNTALLHLHVRGIQISSEIMTLMESGFADGAMARWRTLHEVTCVAAILHDGGNDLAERYLAHEIVETKKDLGQYQKNCALLGYAPFSKRDVKKIESAYDAAITRYGKDFGGDYGWAAVYLSTPRPNFSQIEDSAGRAMMRSHYKMASHNVHASAKGIVHRLGTLERRFGGIGGASNVGFVEPGQNLAASLLHLTTLLLPRQHTLDTVASLMALIKLERRVGPALMRAERAIVRDEHRIRQEKTSHKAKRKAESAK